MAQVICTLPNASEDINGLQFAAVDGGMLSADASDEQVAYLTSIEGFSVYDPNPKPPAVKKGKKAADPDPATVPTLTDTVNLTAEQPAAGDAPAQ